MKYHYVIFGYKRDYFSVMFDEAVKECEAEYISDPIECSDCNTVLKMLYRIHHNPYLNWRWSLPLKRLWFPRYYNNKVDKSICFIFLMGWFRPEYEELYLLLRRLYPNCKMVVYFEDLVCSRPRMDMSMLKYFDYGVSYDEGDCQKYKFLYYSTFLSKVDIVPQVEKTTDACFIGLAKDRSAMINSVFRKLSTARMKCDFIVSRSGDGTKKEAGIQYINKEISYIDYLQHVVNTKCIVELMHHNAVGYTLRTWEALLYDKILLTNNPKIREAPFYDSRQFIVFDSIEDIDIESLVREVDNQKFDTKSISPVRFLEFLETTLNK